ncbi:hypothetical protein PCE1_004380 [Barthelona sp. PCE]
MSFKKVALVSAVIVVLAVSHVGLISNQCESHDCECAQPEEAEPFINENPLVPPDPAKVQRKEWFLQKYRNVYGYNGTLERLRHDEFKYLKSEIYLDFTGSGLYQLKQIDKVHKALQENLYGNAHSRSAPALRTEHEIHSARKAILDFYNAKSSEYASIFTSGSTGAMKLLSDTFPWDKQSHFVYLKDNHNSVLAIRAKAQEKGGRFTSISEDDVVAILRGEKPPLNSSAEGMHLFAFPAESNFSGRKYPLEWIKKVQEGALGPGKWFVFLDSAAYVPTNELDIGKYKPDFFCMSFYKMFGFPTGLGALMVKRESGNMLNKIFWGGGTVVFSACDTNTCQPVPRLEERFEDGTVAFLDILSINYGFSVINELGIKNIQSHTWALREYAYHNLTELRHSTGQRVIEIVGSDNPNLQGGILTFHVVRPDGEYLGFREVSKYFERKDIHIRSGCHCNPGGCTSFCGLTDEQFLDLATSRTSCGDDTDLLDGKPLGAIRMSVGYPTTFEDIDAFLSLVSDTFIDYKSAKQQSFEDFFV